MCCIMLMTKIESLISTYDADIHQYSIDIDNTGRETSAMLRHVKFIKFLHSEFP